MSKQKIILIGAGGHAQACIDVIEQHGQYQIAGLTGMPDELGTLRFGYTVFATDNDLPALAAAYQYAFIAVGQIQTSDHRIRLYQRAIELGFHLPVIIAPSAYVSRHATVGAGSIAMHNAIVNAGATVGINCIINTRALLEHGARVADHCHISTGAIVNGDASVGMGTFVGSASVIKEGITIGKSCVIGMGVSVRHNQADQSRCVGNDKS